MSAEGTEVKQLSAKALENYIARFSRSGRHLPAIINRTNGFQSKDDIIELLKLSELGENKKTGLSYTAQDRLWLGGDTFTYPAL